MTIKYLDSRRIEGLSSDTKPTNVETNSILVTKDTANRYWYDGSMWVQEGFTPTNYNFSTTYGTQLGELKGAGNLRNGQKITDSILNGKTINNAKWWLKKNTSPTGTAVTRIRLVSDDSIVATSSTVDVSTISTSIEEITFTFAQETLPSAAFYCSCEYGGSGGSVETYGKTSAVTNQNFAYYTTSWSTNSWAMAGSLNYNVAV